MKQEILKFDFNNFTHEKTFCVSRKNFFAYELVKSWPDWPKNALLIYGPEKCGKSLITQIWREKSKAIIADSKFFENFNEISYKKINKRKRCWIIEDIELLIESGKRLEEKILNFINILSLNNNFFIITCNKPPKQIKFSIPDLESRLNALIIAEVKEPDQELLKEIIKKKLKSKQIYISQKNLNFLITRIDRTYFSAIRVAEDIDKKSLQNHSNITVNFIKKILMNY